MAEKGQLSINSENMFPIIKKWLYSDHDIFYRELISNGCDAITKLKKLEMMGECELPEDWKARIDVVLDPEGKTIQIIDNGLGMTADEVKEYINNIAFSGAEAFMNKYKDKANSDQIIGHFGLGFYSAFMVADLVTIDTLSYQKGAKAVHWECSGGSEFSMEDSDRKEFGTTITLHLSEDCVEFSNTYRAREVIEKYCGFMPTEIYLSVKDTKDTQIIKESERRPDDVVLEVIEPKKDEKKEEKKDAESDGKKPEGEAGSEDKKPEAPAEKELKIRKRPELLNDPSPLWGKNPKDCTEEEYKSFYRKLFRDYKEPLFWIHLNMDYPFNLKGILYFPKINLEYESAEGVIKLYNNQVFIADNIKEVIPEFLMLLKGVIDCPDLPLNVSRSALQNDGFAQKISEYITKKVADKLAGMCKTDKDNYDKYWDDISPFIKYGCLKDGKFCEKMTDYILFKDLDGKYLTLPEALEVNRIDPDENDGKQNAVDENGDKVEAEVVDDAAKAKDPADDEKEDKKDRTIYYVTDEQQQGQYIRMFREHKLQAFVLNANIDTPFIQQLEMKNEGIHFARIDAGVDEVLQGETSKEAAKALEEKGKALEPVVRKAVGSDKLQVVLQNLKDKDVSSILKVDEQNRRMQDMMKMYSMNGADLGMFKDEGQTLILNAEHPLVQYVLEHEETEEAGKVCAQLYDLARLQNAPLTPEEMTAFVARSNEMMLALTKEGKTEKAEKEEKAEEKAEEKVEKEEA